MKRGLLVLLVFLVVVIAGVRCAHVGEVPGAASLQTGSLEHGGRTRTFLFAAPESTKGPVPLVLALHGRLGTSEGMARLTGLVPLAQREGFLVVFPQGVNRSWADARKHGPAAEQGVDDVAFLAALIDDLVALPPNRPAVDPTRVYVLGMSNGGMMSLTLACRLSDRLAAVGSVTGAVPAVLKDDCAGPAVPVALIQGDKDPLVPFAGGEVARNGGPVLSAAEGAALFAQRDGCAAQTVQALADTAPDDGTTTEVQISSGCRESAEVRLYTVKGGGHTWPGGWRYLRERFVGRMSKDFEASEELWRFFRRFTRTK